MRPRAVAWFERLWLATLAIDTVRAAASWSDPEFADPDIGPRFAVAVEAFTIVLVAVLVLLTARRRSRAAMWILIALYAFTAQALAVFLWDEAGFAELAPGLATMFVDGVGLGLLFTPAARAWLRARRDPAASSEGLTKTFE